MSHASFTPDERRLLLSMPGIGTVVVQRLEEAGYASLQALREAGAARVVQHAASHPAWLNRRRAIERAIDSATERTRACDSPR